MKGEDIVVRFRRKERSVSCLPCKRGGEGISLASGKKQKCLARGCREGAQKGKRGALTPFREADHSLHLGKGPPPSSTLKETILQKTLPFLRPKKKNGKSEEDGSLRKTSGTPPEICVDCGKKKEREGLCEGIRRGGGGPPAWAYQKKRVL